MIVFERKGYVCKQGVYQTVNSVWAQNPTKFQRVISNCKERVGSEPNKIPTSHHVLILIFSMVGACRRTAALHFSGRPNQESARKPGEAVTRGLRTQQILQRWAAPVAQPSGVRPSRIWR